MESVQSVTKRYSSTKSQAPGAANARDRDSANVGSADKLDFKYTL